MTMRRHGDLMASMGEYTDESGRTVKRWQKVGVVMKDDRSGALSIRLDAVPVRPGWSGWLSVREVRERNDHDDRAPIAPPDAGGDLF